eukprot:g2459.t1 g2459   contig12:171376-172611(+)
MPPVVNGDAQPGNLQRRVAILLPGYTTRDDTNTEEDDSPWQQYSIEHLNKIAVRLKLPIIDNTKSIDDDEADVGYSHCITTVPYPRVNSYALAIHANPPTPSSQTKRRKKSSMKLDPFFVDLCPPSDTRLGYRMNRMSGNQSNGRGGGELLLKALGLGKLLSERQSNTNDAEDETRPLVVYDLTAGLARDSLVILTSTFGNNASDQSSSLVKLHMIERDPIVASLVSDAMRRLHMLAGSSVDAEDIKVAESERNNARRLVQSLSMEEGDAISVLEKLLLQPPTEYAVLYPPDICYLDPMFPPRKKKSSAVKKDIAMLHSLLGTAFFNEDFKSDSTNLVSTTEDVRIQEERTLLAKACDAALKRVVVKRPASSPPLGFLDNAGVGKDGNEVVRKPSYDVRGSVNRWDVYINS